VIVKNMGKRESSSVSYLRRLIEIMVTDRMREPRGPNSRDDAADRPLDEPADPREDRCVDVAEGLRHRSAKPVNVGSNPTVDSKMLRTIVQEELDKADKAMRAGMRVFNAWAQRRGRYEDLVAAEIENDPDLTQEEVENAFEYEYDRSRMKR
jgi:hypothetical protein